MILISVALKVEAFPIIDFFKLKPFNDNKFSIYVFDDIALIITGVGKINSAIATSYLSLLFKDKIKAFLNIGIAGHIDLDLGSIILAHKIIDEGSKKEIFPSLLFDLNILTKQILCVDKSTDVYEKDYVYDMESFGFFKAASKFVLVDLIHSVKIISDNKNSIIEDLTKDKIKTLMFQNIETIENIISQLIELSKKVNKKMDFSLKIFDCFHFTECEKHQLKDLLWKINSLDEKKLDRFLKKDFENIKNKKELFSYLKDFYKNTKLVL